MPSSRFARRSRRHRDAARSLCPKICVAVLGLALALALAACTPLPTTPATQPPGAGAAANRVIFWTKCSEVVALTDAQLDAWHDRGVTGFVCKLSYLYALGGPQNFSPDPSG